MKTFGALYQEALETLTPGRKATRNANSFEDLLHAATQDVGRYPEMIRSELRNMLRILMYHREVALKAEQAMSDTKPAALSGFNT